MLDTYLRDVGYLSSDLMTGKSLPVIMAIALLPLDPSLLGTMVLVGTFAGSCVTLSYAWNRATPGPVTWGMRFLNLAFSALLNLAFALHVVGRLGGPEAWMLPAFCVVMQSVPERPSTLVVLSSLTFFLFYTSVFETAQFRLTADVALGGLVTIRRQARALLSISVQEVLTSLWRSLAILILATYASACHGPVTSVGAQTQRYTSGYFLSNRLYAVVVCASAALTRSYTYLATAFLQDHALHVLLDGQEREPEPFTSWLYLVCLAYSASWSCTQFTDQVLTALPANKTETRAQVTVLLFILAYWMQWDWPIVFWSTVGMFSLTVCSIVVATIAQSVK